MSELDEIKKWLRETEDEPLEEMSAFFGARTSDYEEHMSHWKYLYEQIGEQVPAGAEKLLDLGCGTGLELDEIFKRHPGIQVVGIDLSPDMLKILGEKHRDKNLRLIQADYFEEPLDEQEYDVVVSFETLHHFKAEKKAKLFEKIYRSLKSGGCYLEVDYVADNDEWEALLFKECERRRKKWNIPEEVFVHFDTPLTLEHELQLIRKAGFSDVEVREDENGDGTPIILAKKPV